MENKNTYEYGPESFEIPINVQSRKLNHKNYENAKLSARRQTLMEAKILFQIDLRSELVFVIAIMPFNHVIGKCAKALEINKIKRKD